MDRNFYWKEKRYKLFYLLKFQNTGWKTAWPIIYFSIEKILFRFKEIFRRSIIIIAIRYFCSKLAPTRDRPIGEWPARVSIESVEEKNTAISSRVKNKAWSEMNRGGEGRVDKIIYTSERATLTFSPTTFDVSFRSFLADNEGWNEIDDRGGRERRKETRKGRPRFSSWPSYCGSLLHAGCPRPAKGLSQRWNEPNARCRLRSPARERNTLSGQVERQKVTDDRLLVNPVMALPLTIIIGRQGQRAQKTLQPLFHAGTRTMKRIENRSYVSLVTRLNWIERVSLDEERQRERKRRQNRPAERAPSEPLKNVFRTCNALLIRGVVYRLGCDSIGFLIEIW